MVNSLNLNNNEKNNVFMFSIFMYEIKYIWIHNWYPIIIKQNISKSKYSIPEISDEIWVFVAVVPMNYKMKYE